MLGVFRRVEIQSLVKVCLIYCLINFSFIKQILLCFRLKKYLSTDGEVCNFESYSYVFIYIRNNIWFFNLNFQKNMQKKCIQSFVCDTNFWILKTFYESEYHTSPIFAWNSWGPKASYYRLTYFLSKKYYCTRKYMFFRC